MSELHSQAAANAAFNDFADRHGRYEADFVFNELSQSYDTRRYVFEDGATSGADLVLHEPPTDPYKCQKNIVAYHSLRAKAARRAFEKMKKSLNGQLSKPNLPPPTKREIDELETLRDQARACNRRLEDAQLVLAELKPEQEVRKERLPSLLNVAKAKAGMRVNQIDI